MRKCVPFVDHFPFSCVIKVNQAYTETAISKEEADMELKCERSRDKKESNQSALRSTKEAEDDADPYFHIQFCDLSVIGHFA